MSKKNFSKGHIVDLLIHIPDPKEGGLTLPTDEMLKILVTLIKTKKIALVGLAWDHNSEAWLKVAEGLKQRKICVIPVTQVTTPFLNCSRFTFNCYFPPQNAIEVLPEFKERLDSMKKLNFTSTANAIVDLVSLYSGFIILNKIDMSPSSLDAACVLYRDFGLKAFDIVHPETSKILQEKLKTDDFVLVASSDARLFSQIAQRSISVKGVTLSFTSIRSIITGKNKKCSLSVNLTPTGVFREKFHAGL